MAKRKKIEEELLNDEVESDINFEEIEDLDEDLITEIEDDENLDKQEGKNEMKQEEKDEVKETKKLEEVKEVDNNDLPDDSDIEELDENIEDDDFEENEKVDEYDEVDEDDEVATNNKQEEDDIEEINNIDVDDNDEWEENKEEIENIENIDENIDTDENNLAEEIGGVDSASDEESIEEDESNEDGKTDEEVEKEVEEEEIDEEEEFIDEDDENKNKQEKTGNNTSTKTLSDMLEQKKQIDWVNQLQDTSWQNVGEQWEEKIEKKEKLDIKEIFNKYKTLIVWVIILVLWGWAIFYGYNNIYKPMFKSQTTTWDIVKKVNVEQVEVEWDVTKKIMKKKKEKINKTDQMKKEFEIVYKSVKKQINSVWLKIDKKKMKLWKMIWIPYVRIWVRVPTLNEINLDLLQEFCKDYVKWQNTEVLCNKTVLKNGINKYGIAYQKYLETKYNNLINKGLLFFYYKDEWKPLKNFIEDMYWPYLVSYLDSEHIQIWNNFLNIFNQYGKISKIDRAVNDKYLKNIYSYLYSKYNPKDKPELFQKIKELAKIYQFWVK